MHFYTDDTHIDSVKMNGTVDNWGDNNIDMHDICLTVLFSV